MEGFFFYFKTNVLHLVQEMSNPKVRPNLFFYPEDTGEYLEEARQASHWLHELPFDEATPMIRLHSSDYYILEPTMLNDGGFCIPYRWFTRPEGRFFAHAWRLEPTPEGWIVHEDQEMEISEDQLRQNFPQLSKDHGRFHVPHPSLIIGLFIFCLLQLYSLTDEPM